MSHRLSLGGSAPLRDSSSRFNSRRQSFGGTGGGSGVLFAPSPAKDRLAMLDDWRRERKHHQQIQQPNDENQQLKRKFENPGTTTLPPSNRSSHLLPVNSMEGTTALERFRMRKQMRLAAEQNQQGQANIQNHDAAITKPASLSTSVPVFMLDDDTEDFGSAFLSKTPSRKSLLSSRAQRRKSFAVQSHSRSMSASKASPMMTQESDVNASFSQHLPSLSQMTTQSAPTPVTKVVDDVEGAGLRSRITEMQQRIEKLEQEKMGLSMANAPLEARFREKEDTWTKEQTRLLQEIESLKQSSQEADERYRDLAVKYETVHEECKQLRFDARKAASTVHNSNNNTMTNQNSIHLKNDRNLDEMRVKLRYAEEEIQSLRLERVSVEKDLHATRIELDSFVRNYDELKAEYDHMRNSKTENQDAEIKLEVLSREHIATAAQLNAVYSDLAATKARAEVEMEQKGEEHKTEIENLKFEMSVLKTRASKAIDNEVEGAAAEADLEDEAVLRARIEERERRIAELETQLLKGEQLRRQMHNRIQELRGNIRVYVRTRPFLPGDGELQDSSIDVSPDCESLCIVDRRGGGDHSFKFDKVFPPSAGQDSVFREVSDFVQSALDGFHVCLFSYGQTGSGKTHTMQGTGNGAMRGIIPRAVEQILNQAKVMHKQRWEFRLSASFLEIYNEELKDLLVRLSEKANTNHRGVGGKLAIKRSRDGKSYVDGLTEVNIDVTDDALGMQQLGTLMESAARARSVASTKMNSQSSRSHSVFMLHLRGVNEETGAVVHGALNLCDLAGSERLDRSGAGSDAKRLRETQSINKSLSCLGDVFNALATGASHVPYRNSKLTYLLQDCLSGDGKALMFVNLSPTTASSNESLCSLRFAQRVNSVELGKATKHIQYRKNSSRR